MRFVAAGISFVAGFVMLLPEQCSFNAVGGAVELQCLSRAGLQYGSYEVGLWIALGLSVLLALVIYNLLGMSSALRLTSRY